MKVIRLFCFCFLLLNLLVFCLPGIALAQDEEEVTPTPPKIEMSVTYPVIKAVAGNEFEFEVSFKYTAPTGAELGIGQTASPRNFLLKTTAPAGWDVYMTPQFQKEKMLSAITLQPGYSFADKIRLVATPPYWPLPEPGEYKITLEAISDDADQVTGSTELTAEVTAKYVLAAVPALQRYDTKAQAGKDNYFSIKVQNQGSAVIDDINFSPTKPEGWLITFNPEKIDSLDALNTKTVDINIKPPKETIAGDYVISLRPTGKQVTGSELSIRVTVESPTIWGWVGVIIIAIVIIGLVVVFMRFSRR